MNINIEQAIESFRNNNRRYSRSERYYRGDHNLAFATEKFQNTFGSLFREFALNLCPAICDAIRDKLKVTGFGVEDAGTGGNTTVMERANGGNRTLLNSRVSAPELGAAARSIWQRNRMGIRAGEVHKEALKNGDAYAIVWPNERDEAAIHTNKAANISVFHDEESPGRILWAAKHWQTSEKRTRLNLFYADRIEKYISVRESAGSLPEAKDFIPVGSQSPPPAMDHRRNAGASPRRNAGDPPARRNAGDPPAMSAKHEHSESVVPNPFGFVPVFHFANNSDIGTPGQSELETAIPIQDGLNKAVLDMLVAMEFCAYRQRWAAGIEIEYDSEGKAAAPFTAGIDHLWIAQNPEARFGDFEAANLEQFLKVKDSFRIDMAGVTGTPLYYLMPQTRGFPSGESLRKAETRFIAKVRDRQESFGQTWADLMAFALMIEGKGENIRLLTQWEDPSPLTDKELLENILLKKEIGISPEQALNEAGYGKSDIGRMVK